MNTNPFGCAPFDKLRAKRDKQDRLARILRQDNRIDEMCCTDGRNSEKMGHHECSRRGEDYGASTVNSVKGYKISASDIVKGAALAARAVVAVSKKTTPESDG